MHCAILRTEALLSDDFRLARFSVCLGGICFFRHIKSPRDSTKKDSRLSRSKSDWFERYFDLNFVEFIARETRKTKEQDRAPCIAHDALVSAIP
jgi:hypothetical protein